MKKFSTLLILFSLLFSYACKKSSIEQTQPAVKGSVLLFDEGGRSVDNSGMVISIENSNPLVSVTTNSSGNFVLPLDPALTSFTLVYSKPQFGTFKRYFTKDDSNKLFYWDLNDTKFQTDQTFEQLGNKSTVTINSFHAAIIGDTLKITCNISSLNEPGEKYIQLLTQEGLPDLSINTVDKTRIGWSHKLPVKNGDNTFNFCLKCSAICNNWIRGNTIYLTAYGDSYYSNMYVDRSNNNLILPNLNAESNLTPVSVVVP
jgi:hypothetical protein